MTSVFFSMSIPMKSSMSRNTIQRRRAWKFPLMCSGSRWDGIRYDDTVCTAGERLEQQHKVDTSGTEIFTIPTLGIFDTACTCQVGARISTPVAYRMLMRVSNKLFIIFFHDSESLFVQQGCYLRVHFLIGITLYIYWFGAAERYACTASLTESRLIFATVLITFPVRRSLISSRSMAL